MSISDNLKTKKLLTSFLIINLIGFCIAVYTLWHHVAVNGDALSGASFCNINSYINCDAVALSKYSTIWGYPVAALLVIYHSLLLLLGLGLRSRTQKNSDPNETYALAGSIFALSSFALIPTFALAYLSIFELKLLCLLCLASYITNVLVWISALLIKNSHASPAFSLPPRSSWTFLFVATATVALLPLVFQGLIGGSKIDSRLMNTIMQQHFTAKPHSIALTNTPSLGPDSAKIVVVEYSDFQCPHCARASKVVPQVVQAYPEVRFVFKNFPLDPACNASIQGQGHSLSCLAAKAGQCVYKAKGSEAFFVYEKKIFEFQSKLSSDFIYNTGAEHSGYSKEELQTCVNSPEIHQFVVEQVNEAIAIGVSGTPSLYINGRRLEYGTVSSVLRAAIQKYKEAATNAGK